MSLENTLTLHFNDGSKLSFDFPEQTANPAARQLKIADFLSSKHVLVEAEGSLMIFPIVNIKYIAITAPGAGGLGSKGMAFPKHVIRGARTIS